MQQKFIKKMRKPALYGLICSIIQLALLFCFAFIIFRPGNIPPMSSTISMYIAFWPLFLLKIFTNVPSHILYLNLLILFILTGFIIYTAFWTTIKSTLNKIVLITVILLIFYISIFNSTLPLNVSILFILISLITYTAFWTIIEFVPNKIKKIILIGVPIVIITIILFVFYIPIAKVYFYEKETNTPISNEYIEIIYSPLCVESPCSSKTIYTGDTKEDGSIKIPLEHSNSMNKKYNLENPYEYFFNIEGYSRWLDPENTLDPSSNIVYLTSTPTEVLLQN